MQRRIRSAVLCLLSVIAIALAGRSPGDVLTTLDGKTLSGRVEKTDTGYTVHTADGVVQVPDANVKHVMLDHAAERTAARKKTIDPKTVQTLQMQGRAAYAAGAFDVARDLFVDAKKVDPGNPVTARGLGMTLMRLDRPAQAVEPLEQAAAAMPGDREALIVLSTALVESHNPMRAVKFLKIYMEKTPAVVDEDCLNALGAALSQADGIAVKQTLFTQAFALYLKENARLEAKRPGEKRWGSTWLPADEVTKKVEDRKKAQKAVATLQAKVNDAAERMSTAQKDMAAYGGTQGDNNRSRMYNDAKNRFDRAQKDLAADQKDLADANTDLAANEPPPFPLLITLDSVAAERSASTTAPSAGAATEPATGPANLADGNNGGPTTAPGANPPPDNVATAKPVGPPIARAINPNAAPAEPLGPVTKYGAAFAVAPDLIVAPASVIAGSRSIHVDVAVGPSFDAAVIRADAAAGLVLIRVPGAKFTPLKIADRVPDKPTTSLGFPSVDIFNPIAETMTVTRSPSGAADHAKFSMPPRIPGAPLLQDKAAVGMEVGGRDTDPAEVPVISADVLRKFVGNDAAPAADGADSVVQLVAQR